MESRQPELAVRVYIRSWPNRLRKWCDNFYNVYEWRHEPSCEFEEGDIARLIKQLNEKYEEVFPAPYILRNVIFVALFILASFMYYGWGGGFSLVVPIILYFYERERLFSHLKSTCEDLTATCSSAGVQFNISRRCVTFPVIVCFFNPTWDREYYVGDLRRSSTTNLSTLESHGVQQGEPTQSPKYDAFEPPQELSPHMMDHLPQTIKNYFEDEKVSPRRLKRHERLERARKSKSSSHIERIANTRHQLSGRSVRSVKQRHFEHGLAKAFHEFTGNTKQGLARHSQSARPISE